MNPVTVFEHQRLPIAFSDAEKGALERMQHDMGCEVFNLGWRDVTATQHVGLVQCGERLIQVLPKIYTNEANQEAEATRNLLYLLDYTLALKVYATSISALALERRTMPEVLYGIFATKLWEAVRRDFLRGYVPVEERACVLKGRWQIGKQLRSSAGWRQDRFEVCYDEFSEDNLPNQILKCAVREVSLRTGNPQTVRNLGRLREVFGEVSDVEIQEGHFERANAWMIAHRRRCGRGHLYRPLLNIARMLLANVCSRLSAGRTVALAYTFDMNVLFEQFIAESITRECGEAISDRGWKAHLQRSPKSLLIDEAGQSQFRLKPDIRFENKAGQTELIIDTKWKLPDAEDAKAGVAERDAYQMFAYAQRYDCPRVILLYPQMDHGVTKTFGCLPEEPHWLQIRTINLRKDLESAAQRAALKAELLAILNPCSATP